MDEILPRFFKVMLPGFHTKLRLPPLVSKKLVEQELEEVILTSHKGSWEVKIQCVDGRLWFTKGWDDFVLQHGIAVGYFVVFQHTGGLCFNVMIFGLTSFERDFHDQPKTSNKRGRTQGKSVCTGQGNPCCTNNSSLALVEIGHNNVFPSQVNIPEHINSVKLEVDKDEVPPPVKIQKHKHAHDKRNAKRGRTQGKNVCTGQGNPCFTNNSRLAPSVEKGHNKVSSSQVNIPERINNVSVKLEVNLDEVPPPVKIQKHKLAHDKGNAKRKQQPKVVNVSSTEQHLQFVTTMKPYNLRRRSPFMHIPADFCQANGLYHNARISLKGPSDEQQVSLRVCRGGRTIYSVITRGWPEFIAGNDLKKGDTCIFKLRSPGSSSNAVVFDVEVLPAAT